MLDDHKQGLTIGENGRAKHLTKKKNKQAKERTIKRASNRTNTHERTKERTNGRTDGLTDKKVTGRTNRRKNEWPAQYDSINTAELPADCSRVFQCIERPWLQIWQMTMTDWLSSASSIFPFNGYKVVTQIAFQVLCDTANNCWMYLMLNQTIVSIPYDLVIILKNIYKQRLIYSLNSL